MFSKNEQLSPPRSAERGFTLIETMIAAGIMVSALLAVAAIFAYSIRTNMYSQQLSTGTVISNMVVENLMAGGYGSLNSSCPSSCGGTNPASPQTGYFNYVDVDGAGVYTMSTSNSGQPYLAMWEVDGGATKRITVSVYATASGASGQLQELMRTTTQLANGR